MERRRFFRAAATGAAALQKLAWGESSPAFILIHSGSLGRRVPDNYIGLQL